jgi:hypothetical protein
MSYLFDISQLEVLTALTYDASVELDQFQKTPESGRFEFTIERRTFENVERSKFLLWTRTKYHGQIAKLRIDQVEEIVVDGNKEEAVNDFILDFDWNASTGQIEMKTTLGLTIKFIGKSSMILQLRDLAESKFGNGRSFGNSGYTKDEWTEFLKEKNYPNTNFEK